jgi:hypothetical protein
MSTININNNIIELKLTSPRSKVRICDESGNHIKKPVSALVNFDNSYIEWMITNGELIQIITQKFARNDVQNLICQLHKINISLRNSDYYSRAAKKKKINQSIGGFSVYKYEEVFYSFEKNVDTNLKVKITFKMGDYTLAAHMFVLIGFNHPGIILENNEGNIITNNPLGSGAKCHWNPSKEAIVEVAKALAHSSIDHRNDLIQLLEDKI